MPTYDGSINIDTRIDSRGFNSGIKGLQGSLGGLMGALGKVAAAVGIAFSVQAVVNFGKAAVDAASQLEAAWTGLQSVLDGQGRSFVGAKRFIQEYVADGLIPATDAIVAYKNLALRGYDDTQIQTVLVALKDASAFGRQASYTMGEAVKTATEGLKNENSILVDNAGVTKNVAKMWDDYAKSIGTTAANLTKQQKIEAEVAGIMEETRFQTGDAAKIAGSYAGQVAALGTSFYNLKVAIGSAIIPVISKVMPYIRAAVDALVVFFNKVARVMSLFFDVEIGGAIDSVNEMATGSSAAADAQNSLANATSKAGKAAKGALAAFDQLNVLQQDEGSGNGDIPAINTGAGGVSAAIDTNAEVAGGAIDELSGKVLAFKDKIMQMLAPVKDSFQNLQTSLEPLKDFTMTGLKDFYEGFLKPVGQWVLGEGLPRFVDALAEGVAQIDWTKINGALKDLWTSLEPFAVKVGEGLLWLWEEVLVPLGVWTTNEVVPRFLGILGDKLDVLSSIIDSTKPLLSDFWNNFLKPVGEWTGTGILGWMDDMSTVLQDVGDWFDNANFRALSFWEVLKIFAQPFMAPLVNAIIWVVENFDDLKAAAGKAFDWLGTKAKEVFGGLREFFRGIVNGVIDLVNGMVRAIAAGLNGVIRNLNSVKIDIPSWVPGVGGQSWSLNIPAVTPAQIPRLATGAVIPPNSEFAAILGDQRGGRNIETPEALMRQIVREEIGNLQADFTINFGGSLAGLVRELKPYIDQENVRIGGSLITGAVRI